LASDRQIGSDGVQIAAGGYRNEPDFSPAVVVSQAAPTGPIGREIQEIEIDGLEPEARE
jgi:hypothetical protein